MIFKSENVLTAEVVQEMFRLRNQVEEVVHEGHRWSDVCLRLVTFVLCTGSGSVVLRCIININENNYHVQDSSN